MKKLLTAFLLIVACSWLQAASQHARAFIQPRPLAAKQRSGVPDSIRYKLISAPFNTYGYDIYLRGRLFVHQPSIPCIAGEKGFTSKKDARKVAVMVKEKIRMGMMPPSVTVQELQALRVLH